MSQRGREWPSTQFACLLDPQIYNPPMERFLSLLDGHGLVIGTWSQFANPEAIDILGVSGFQFTIVDTEHGHFGLETAENLVRACDAVGLVPIVRVPTNENYMITKALGCAVEAAARSNVPVVMPLFSPDVDECRQKIDYW